MSTRVRSRTLVLLVLGALLVAGSASPATATGSRSGEVATWLARASAAQTDLAWSGTTIISTWSSGQTGSSLLDLVHQPGRGLTVSRHGAGSGTVTGESHDDDVTMPDQPTGTAYLAMGGDGSPAPLLLLTSHYDVALDQTGQVAGRPVQSLMLRRGARAAARLWLDEATGLLLRREVYDGAGRTVSAMAFLDVTITGGTGWTAPAPIAATTSADGVAAVRRAGWLCPRQIGSDLVLYDARTVTGSDAGPVAGRSTPIMHLSYSDGLSSLSVFQQRGRLDPAALAGYAVTEVGGHRVRVRRGLQTNAVWQSGGTVVTVISDEPAWQLVDVVAALPPSHPVSGWMAAAARHVLNAARWLTPLR